MDNQSYTATRGRSKANLKPIPRKQAFLESYFHSLRQFSFDRSKDLVEREKEQFPPNVVSPWYGFLTVLINLSQVEKTYFSLQYVERRFIRRDIIRPIYGSILHELKKLEDVTESLLDDGETADSADGLLAELSKQLGQFISARQELVDFYEFMTKSGWGHHYIENRSNLIDFINQIVKKHDQGFHHRILEPLKASYSLEVDVVQFLFQAESEMACWDMSSSLMLLHKCHGKLACWREVLPSSSGREQLLSSVSIVHSFGGGSPSKSNELHVLYHWLAQMHSRLVAKFSLYFYTTLRNQTSGNEIKTLFSKASVDYFAKFSTFLKKSDAYMISIILDINSPDIKYKGHGYHLPNIIHDNPTGIDSFSPILRWPEEASIKEFWPDVISILSYTKSDQVMYFHDEKTVRTYYMIKIDTAMTLAVVFNTKRKEKDSLVQNFLQDTKSLLVHDKLYQMLKPGQVYRFI